MLINIDEIEKKLRELREKLLEVDREIKMRLVKIEEEKVRLRVKRDEIRKVIESLESERKNLNIVKSKIQELKCKREELLKKLKDLKEERRQVIKELKCTNDNIRRLKELHQKLTKIVRGERDKEKIRSMIEKLEYDYETSPTIPEREKKFIRIITDLSKKLNILEATDKVKSEIENLRSKILKYRERIYEINNTINQVISEVREIKEEVQVLNSKRSEIINNIVNLKKLRDELKSERDNIKFNILKMYVELKELRRKFYEISDELNRCKVLAVAAQRSKIIVEKRRKYEELISSIERVERELLEKLRRGERVEVLGFSEDEVESDLK